MDTDSPRDLATLTFRQPLVAAMLLFVMVTLGVTSLLTNGRQEDPTITNLFATITTPFPGADPGRVEALVTIPNTNRRGDPRDRGGRCDREHVFDRRVHRRP